MSTTHFHSWPGVPLALASAVLFGAYAPLSKLLIGSVDPWLLAGILHLGAGLGLALMHRGRAAVGLEGVEAPLRRSDAPWLGAVILFGALLIAGVCLCWGIDNNLTRKLSSADPVQIAMLKGLVAGTVNLLLTLSAAASLPGAGLIAAGAVVVFLGVGVSLVLFMLALRHLGAARTGAHFSLAPFIGAVLAVALFREPVTAQLLVASALMGFGLWLHFAERHVHEHVHELLEHEHAHTHDEHHQHVRGPDDPASEPQSHLHWHRHEPLHHGHPHYPDLHHRHEHGSA